MQSGHSEHPSLLASDMIPKYARNLKGELINMTQAWVKKKIESPTGIEPMTS